MLQALRRSRWSRTGLGLVGAYALLTALALGAALWSWTSGDLKGHFVLLQLPVALQLAAVPASWLRQWGEVSWMTAYLVIWPLTALALYTVGRCLTALLK